MSKKKCSFLIILLFCGVGLGAPVSINSEPKLIDYEMIRESALARRDVVVIGRTLASYSQENSLPVNKIILDSKFGPVNKVYFINSGCIHQMGFVFMSISGYDCTAFLHEKN